MLGSARLLFKTGILFYIFFFFQAEDGIRDVAVTGVQTVLFRSALLKQGQDLANNLLKKYVLEGQPLEHVLLQQVVGQILALLEQRGHDQEPDRDGQALTLRGDHALGQGGAHRTRERMGAEHGVHDDLQGQWRDQRQRRGEQPDQQEEADVREIRARLEQQTAKERELGASRGIRHRSDPASATARRRPAMAKPQSLAIQTARAAAPPPTPSAAAGAPASAEPTAASVRNAATATPPGAQRLQSRIRTICRPCPCSSTAIRMRPAPNSPPRSSRSQRSKSPPRRTTPPDALSAASTDSRRCQEGLGFSLHVRSVRRPGIDHPRPGPPRQGVSPWRRRPIRRPAGWARCRKAVSGRRPSRSRHVRGEPGNEARRVLRHAWRIGTASAPASAGSAYPSGCQAKLPSDSAPRASTTRYHSGIRVRDARVPALFS